MLMRLRAPRLKKKLIATLDNGNGIIENISTTGGFLKTDMKFPKGQLFKIELKLMGQKTIRLLCESRRCDDSGVGFKLLNVEDSKEELFNQYVKNQFTAFEKFGRSRKYTTEIMVTLKDTNVFGNVYFSNFIEYQGVIREKFLLFSVPDLHNLLVNEDIRLVTVEAYNKYISNAYFGDVLVVELTTSEIKAASCRLNIVFKNKKTGELIGKGYQTFCVVKSNGKVVRLPEELLEPLDFYQEVTDQ